MDDDFDEEYDDHDGDYSYEDRICDDMCRGVNNCGGHATCSHCGDVVCGCELDPDSGLCPCCYESRKTCENCGETFFDEGLKTSDGEAVCSQECWDDWESGLESGRIKSDKSGGEAGEGPDSQG